MQYPYTPLYTESGDTITFSNDFNNGLTKGLIELLSKFSKIVFGNNYNSVICHCPNSITHINFGHRFNQTIDFIQPVDKDYQSITHIVFGNDFNQPINLLPLTIQYLEFSKMFNQPLDNLPNGLTHLYLSSEFNHPLNNLPNTLKHLIIRTKFTHSLDNLPESLTHLSVYCIHNVSVDNLPAGLEWLTLGNSFDGPIDNLPNSLTSLTLINSTYKQSFDVYKPGIDGIPRKKLTFLNVGFKFDSEQECDEFVAQFPNVKVKFI